jgi:hypothetical protein
MIADCPALDQPTLAWLAACDPVVQDYRAFFALLDWRSLPVARPARPRPRIRRRPTSRPC